MSKNKTMKEFLKFLEKDLINRPEQLRPLSQEKLAKAKELTKGMDVDINTPIEDDEND